MILSIDLEAWVSYPDRATKGTASARESSQKARLVPQSQLIDAIAWKAHIAERHLCSGDLSAVRHICVQRQCILSVE